MKFVFNAYLTIKKYGYILISVFSLFNLNEDKN